MLQRAEQMKLAHAGDESVFGGEREDVRARALALDTKDWETLQGGGFETQHEQLHLQQGQTIRSRAHFFVPCSVKVKQH